MKLPDNFVVYLLKSRFSGTRKFAVSIGLPTVPTRAVNSRMRVFWFLLAGAESSFHWVNRSQVSVNEQRLDSNSDQKAGASRRDHIRFRDPSHI